jgi:predicted DNA binding CopG/RHH family protein
MERPMKKSKLPKIDSIEKLAEFWDTHDLTDFESELEEVAEPVFVRGNAIKVHLKSREAKAVQQMAQAKGVSPEELIRAWVLQELARRNNGRRTSMGASKVKGRSSP